MASIQRIVSTLTGEVTYRAQVRVKGRPTQSENFPNKKEAVNWASGIESAIRENRHHPHLAGGKKSFAEVAKRYRDSILAHARATTRSACEKHLDWWEEYFTGKTIAEITPDLTSLARDTLSAGTYTRGKMRTVKGLEIQASKFARSGATVNRYLSTLSKLFDVAKKEWRLVDRNPVRDISKKKEPRGRVRFLSDAERDALLSASANSSWPSLHTLVVLAISTGARRGELINLEWSRVDLKTGTATVLETKNGDARTLPLVGKALEALRALKLQGSAKSPWVFPQPSEHPSGPFIHFDGAWRDARDDANLKGFRFHDLRHTCASYLASQGASLLEIADVLGHRSMSMVKRYSHLATSHKTSVIERMAKERGL
jgi:integrase